MVENAGKTMDEIVTEVRRVSDIISGITTASREQLDGIEQVNQAIVQMTAATQQNAAVVQQSASATDNLSGQAQSLIATVARFKLESQADTGDGKRARPTAMPRAEKSRHALPNRTDNRDGNWKEF